MALKPGPKPIAKSTGKTEQRRRDNKATPSSSSDSKNNITQTCTTPPRPNSK